MKSSVAGGKAHLSHVSAEQLRVLYAALLEAHEIYEARAQLADRAYLDPTARNMPKSEREALRDEARGWRARRDDAYRILETIHPLTQNRDIT